MTLANAAWDKYVDLSMRDDLTTNQVITQLAGFIVDTAADELESHAHAIVKAGDQFDKGGDIYSHYKPTMQAAEIVRALKL